MKQHNAIFILIFLVIVQFAQPGYAAEPLGRRIVLDNGMVLLLSEKHDLPMVTINMAIHAGSMVEPADKPGLASITASLLMQGTAKRTATRISSEIDFVGGSLSVSAEMISRLQVSGCSKKTCARDSICFLMSFSTLS